MGENYIICQDTNGSINISEDVIANMVRTAITEVEGVAGLSNTAGTEIAELIGMQTKAVNKRYQRLLKKCRDLLAEETTSP